MITISLCMIVRNEQNTLEQCLQSIRNIVDEIIIVDTGSIDQTKDIASKWSVHIFDFEWIDDFGAARNFAFSKATMDYILWLDADDVLLSEESQKLIQLKRSMSSEVDAVSMQYYCEFDDHGNVTLNVRRTRIVKRSRNYQWVGAVHEDLLIKDGIFYDSDIVVTHRKHPGTSDPDRNLKIYEKLLSAGKKFTIRDTLHYAMELHHHQLHQKATTFYLKCMNMEESTTEDCIYICSKLADCYYHLGDRAKEREFIFKSFEYDIPRSEFCCRLGYFFLEKSQFSQAVFWYNVATESPMPNNRWAILNDVSRTWLPHMQLGLCYYQMAKYELSYHHNKIALSYLPNDLSLLSNIELLEEIMSKK